MFANLIWPEESVAGPDEGIAWLWNGYVAPGKVTLLTSQWKSGKTTLVAVLLARMGRGGGRPGSVGAYRPGVGTYRLGVGAY